MTKDILTTPPELFLRQLDGFEEHFWIMEHIARRGHVLAAEIEGKTSVECWKDAFSKLQTMHPLLRASIGKTSEQRPFFYLAPEREFPLHIRPLSESFSTARAIELELQEAFLNGEPLTRATLFYSPERSTLLIASHHAALDGRSHLYLLRDVLGLLTQNGSQQIQMVAPSVANLFGRKPVAYSKTLTSVDSMGEEDQPNYSANPIHIKRMELSKSETDELVLCAKTQKTSVHSAVLTAIALAGARTNDTWRNEGIRCLCPVDVRSLFGLGERLGQLIALHPTALRSICEDTFWETARMVTLSMKDTPLRESLQRFLDTADGLVAYEHSPKAHLDSLLRSWLVHDLMLTSYGSHDIQTSFGSLQLNSVCTAGFAGGPDTQKFSTLTVNGALGFTHVAHQPFPEILAVTKTILQDAIHGISQ